MFKVAVAHGVTPAAVIAANPLISDPNVVRAGSCLFGGKAALLGR